jgi:retron-type reverse transcriptase
MIGLQDIFKVDKLRLAYFRVRCWTERISKDQVGLRAFSSDIDVNLSILSNKLIEGSWTPSRGFKFYVPKSSGTQRTKTLLFVEDAIVYQAIADLLAEQNYELLHENNDFVFGSVLSSQVKKGIKILDEEEPDYFFFLHWSALYRKFIDSVKISIETDNSKYRFETDITGFFDSIPHYCLLSLLSTRFNVGDDVLDLMSDCLNMWSGTKDEMTPGVGIPQGPAPSYFFANLLLHDLDDLIISKGFKYYRYMDDIKIYWYNKEELNRALVLIDNYLKGKGLSLNSKKTSIEELTLEKKADSVKDLEKKYIHSGLSLSEWDIEQMSGTNNMVSELGDISEDVTDRIDVHDHDRFELISSITDRGDIISAWNDEKEFVETELMGCFTDPNLEMEKLSFKEGVTDSDLINLSFRYFSAIRALQELDSKLYANRNLIKYWLFAYAEYYWRASSFGLTLSLYGRDQKIKAELERHAIMDLPIYEWVQYHALMQLSISQEFSDKELREVYFRAFSTEGSALVRLGLYRLLFRHGEKTLLAALKKQLQKEPVSYLKILVADFNRKFAAKEIDIVEFIEFIGL